MIQQNIQDVTILGGGLAGMTLAKQLRDKHPRLSILVLDKRRHPVAEGAYKVGESTIEVGAYYLSEEIGLKKHLVDHHLPKFGLRFFFGNGQEELSDAVEVGLSDFFPAPGFQIDRGRLENHLVEVLTQDDVRFQSESEIRAIHLNDNQPHVVEYSHNGQHAEVHTHWLIDATGRRALLKRQLDLRENVNHNVNAFWFRIGHEFQIDQWCESEEWRERAGRLPRRWLSTNHLLGEGYWMWIIPLASGATSFGVVADPRLHPLSEFKSFDRLMDWLADHEPLCAAQVAPHREKLQDFKAIKRLAYGCREVFSANRWAITGEAGVFLDPLYSPGIDYIAMGNTMIEKLIATDLAGDSIDLMAPRLQGLFLTLFQDNLMTYEDQYQLFGNPRIMSMKYVWDYALYWSFPAFLYMNGKIADPQTFSRLGQGIEQLRELNREMQAFLRSWNEQEASMDADPVFVNQNEIAILKQLNAELKDELDDQELTTRFQRNVGILTDLSREIASRVADSYPEIVRPEGLLGSPRSNRLCGVFEALGI